jgi:hypothetical protein
MLEDIARFGVIENVAVNPTNEKAVLYKQKADEIVAQWREAALHVKESADLTDVGKTGELHRLAADYLAKLDKLEQYLRGCDGVIEEMRAALTVDDPVDDGVIAVIWQHLPMGDGLHLQQVYHDAIENGERQVFDAIRRMPRFMSAMTPDQVADGEAMWADKSNPARSQELREAQRALAAARQARDRARSIIHSESGLPAPDSIARIAVEGTG